MPDIKLKIGGKFRTFHNAQSLIVPAADGGTVRFTYKQGTYIQDHAGTADVAEFAEVQTGFPEYTEKLQSDDAQKTAQIDSLVDKAIEHGDDVSNLFPLWAVGTEYNVGTFVRYNGSVYKCIQSHTSQSGWEPASVPALWLKKNPTEEWPEWVQPTGAHDAYAAGDKVSHSGKHWQSTINANVYEPGVYGWNEVT